MRRVGFASILGQTNFKISGWAIAVALMSGVVAVGPGYVAHAQVAGTGTIQGLVLDPSGNAIVGAVITATNTATGRVTTQPTSSAGVYVLSALPPGDYSVDFKAPGFQPVHQQQITVNAISVVGLNMTLKVGTETTQLVVTAAPPDLDTENGSLDTTIPNSTYSELPVAMSGGPKSPLGFLSQIPGSASGDFGVQDINGGPGNTAFLYQNGLPITTSEMQGDARNVNGSTSTEVVDQFQVITSGIPAYYGGQGVTNLVLKSGTNQFHGEAFDYFRNEALDARNYFNRNFSPTTGLPLAGLPGEKAPLKRNNFGGSVGGPIWKGKTFFYASYEGLRQHQGILQNSTVLTPAQQATIAANAATFPVAAALAKLIPLPNSGNNYVAFTPGPVNIDQYTGDVLHQFSSNSSSKTEESATLRLVPGHA